MWEKREWESESESELEDIDLAAAAARGRRRSSEVKELDQGAAVRCACVHVARSWRVNVHENR